jgi:hypothetical protein
MAVYQETITNKVDSLLAATPWNQPEFEFLGEFEFTQYLNECRLWKHGPDSTSKYKVNG